MIFSIAVGSNTANNEDKLKFQIPDANTKCSNGWVR